jgi:nucleoside 2-deoxyribosyltransferase
MTIMPHERTPIAQENRQASPIVHSFEQGQAEHDTLYDLVIEPVVRSCRDELRRLDRLQTPSAITRQIEDGIRTSDYCIAVLDGFRPNVLYEMGYAHALSKPLIVILRKGELDQQEVPFDISTLNRIEYVRPDGEMFDRLKRAVLQVVRRGATSAVMT